ncbi:MAG: thiamine-phosphate kinase [Brevinematia bacterium]
MRVNEFELIKYIREITDSDVIPKDVVIPNGDDCFVFSFNGDAVVTTDTMVDGVHFLTEKFLPYDIGVKSAVSNLSDIASMGALPLYALTSIILPPFFELDFVLDVYRGMVDIFSKYNVYIGGGNVSRGRDFTISVTLFGKSNGKILKRSGAKEGDLIFVSGFVGDSSLGLEILVKKGKGVFLSDVESYLVSRHVCPIPRIELGLRILDFSTSCIDVSDGLIQDLEHILESSGVGGVVHLESIPTSQQYSIYISRQKIYGTLAEFFKYPLAGGEDYELIFTVPPPYEQEVYNISKELSVKITKIGEITNSRKLEIYYFDKKIEPEEYKGWKHF